MRIALSALALLISFCAHADWKVIQRANPDGPGEALDVLDSRRSVARLVYGEGQIKPYLHVFGESGELLTNSGTDKDGKATGTFPHHRGIFIGWRIVSELGTDDLWHMTKGCRMEMMKLEKVNGITNPLMTTKRNAAHISAFIDWRSANKDTNGSDLLLREHRQFAISQPSKGRTQIDSSFGLMPMRDLRLAGDLQHSGIHFRAANEVHDQQSQTSYITEPKGKHKGSDLKWCRFVFPIGKELYSALQINHPSNPVEELSTRGYGRFGYFFKTELKKEKLLTLRYRFVVERVGSPDDTARARAEAERMYEQFAKSRWHEVN